MGLWGTMPGASIATYIAMEVPQTSYFNISSIPMPARVLSTPLPLQLALLSLGERDTGLALLGGGPLHGGLLELSEDKSK